MKVSDLARRAQVTAETVRHYVREGLLEFHRDPDNGYRVFGDRALAQLRFVRRARRLGFKLAEVRRIFALAETGDSPCPEVREIVDRRLRETRALVEELTALCGRMEHAVSAWAATPDRAPTGHSICHLIEEWDAGQASPPSHTVDNWGGDPSPHHLVDNWDETHE